ncbi:phosphoribosyl-dephospho-CoA transferase [Desmospora activa DSM 45169]|uniref:Phosphoribosyl-dephospho-CoA transferase n=1 Tax=Desmospora activa DSM 45169 TaxID=1121389 RepID=A0A2T4Z4N3_9BACL|nr:phosphoribosyl-dephospho-CoA transferase [Desmospora activa DSM 45169]
MPHYLLRLGKAKDLVTDVTPPEWVGESLCIAPWVVVRRAPVKNGLIPVGVRGKERKQRFAAYLPPGLVQEQISPERLAVARDWQKMRRSRFQQAIAALDVVKAIMERVSLSWGPVGSVGFELATGVPVVKPTSDLDLILRTPDEIPYETAHWLVRALEVVPVRVDVQIETAIGAVALTEYAGEGEKILLRTMNGPVLITREEL